MVLVTAVVEPPALHDVRSGWDRLDVAGMTVSGVSGVGSVHREGGPAEGRAPAVRVEALVEDALAGQVVDVVVRAARGGGAGRGRVWVVPVDTAVRVRTGERGADAL